MDIMVRKENDQGEMILAGLDTIKGLGDFVEIEYKAETKKKPAQITKEMVDFLKYKRCGKNERK